MNKSKRNIPRLPLLTFPSSLEDRSPHFLISWDDLILVEFCATGLLLLLLALGGAFFNGAGENSGRETSLAYTWVSAFSLEGRFLSFNSSVCPLSFMSSVCLSSTKSSVRLFTLKAASGGIAVLTSVLL